MATRIPEGRARPRKHPRQARSTATVDAILEAAARILEERGHEAFSTNAVAARAGVSIGSLYQYFPRKDALIGALIARETARLLEEAQGALAAPGGREGLEAVIAACVSHQFRRPALARLLDFEEARSPFDESVVRVKDGFHEVVAELLSRPDLPPQADTQAAARDVEAIIKGVVDNAGAHGEVEHGRVAARVRRAVFGYLWS